MLPTDVAGLEPGQRRLNGPQTTGRSYRNLSSAASHDTGKGLPAIMHFTHAAVGEAARNTVHSSSRLVLPVVADEGFRIG